MEAPVKAQMPLASAGRKRKFMTISPSAKRRVRTTGTPRFLATPWDEMASHLKVDLKNRNELLGYLKRNTDKVNMMQEMLLWRRPRAFITFFGVLNLFFLAFSRFSMPSYCYLISVWIFLILWRIYDSRTVSFAKDSLFSDISVDEEEEVPEEKLPDGIELPKPEQPEPVEEPETNRLRTLDELTDLIMSLAQPFLLIRDIFTQLNSDKSPRGLAVMAAIYTVLFWATYVVDWFWIVVLAIDSALLFPGIYCHPTLWKKIEQIKEGWTTNENEKDA